MIEATDARQLHHPRLRPGIRWFDDGDELIVRSARGSVAVSAGLRDLTKRLLPSLDGRRGLGELVSGLATRDGLSAIALLSAFAERELVVEGEPDPFPGTPEASGRLSISVRGSGVLAHALRSRTNQAGAFSVFVLDGPDMAVLDSENRAAYDARRAWLPVFPFGDVVIVGPLIRPGWTACFRCFELRWLGISPTSALERRYLTALRRGLAHAEVQQAENADRLADRVLPLIAMAAADPAIVRLLSLDEDGFHQARLERHPLCDVCGSSALRREADAAGDANSWREAARDLAEVAQAIAGLVDRYVGIVAEVPTPFENSDCLPAIALARYAAPQPELVTTHQANWTHGSGHTAAHAHAVAQIEAIERYCGLFPPRADVIACFADLAGCTLSPPELPLFSARQYATAGFPYRPFAPDKKLGWTWGWNVTRGARVLVPSAAVWYGAEDQLVGETSNGVAAHSARGHALHNAVLELIERDAFMIHWLQRMSPPLFDLGQLTGEFAALAARVEQAGYRVILADLTTDLAVPVVLALGVHDAGERPALLVGAGASLDPVQATRHALRELNAAATGLSDAWRLSLPLQPHEVVELEDHSRAYEHPDWLPRAAFLWGGETMKNTRLPASPAPGTLEHRAVNVKQSSPSGGGGSRSETEGVLSATLPLRQPCGLPPPPKGEDRSEPNLRHGALDQLVAHLAGKHHEVIGIDITTPEVALCGVRVVRAIVPGLQPLAFGQRIRLGGRRLYEAPQRMDPGRRVLGETELNPFPHCFP